MKTLNQLAKEAILVQDACNLSGVIHSFSGVITNLRELFPSMGTSEMNHHPIVVLWASKVASLTSCEHDMTFHDAYKQCADWAL